MVSNPMQKKVRNYFLLGVLITLITCLIIFALVYFLLIDKDSEELGEEIIAYVLNQDVESGGTITSSMLSQITVYSSMVPSNYIDVSTLSQLQSQSESGEVVAKVAMTANTVLTSELVTSSDAVITSDVRYVEYNMLTLPTTLAVGDYIDIRLTLPNGQDLIVVSKKEVQSILGNTIGLEMAEEDILMMESAIVEAYIMSSAKLYVIQYVEPGNQDAAVTTYVPTEAVQALIEADANIVDTARTVLLERFEANSSERSLINSEKNNYSTESKENLEEGIQEEIDNAKAAREAYLSGLTSY